ncbi:cyclic AMP-responsive element-binding protein 1 isoform X2 [Microplitis mediator]|uniref:cyclic AMP-responsive element-binding protein 1 isoform X2 n=1 Tax=Microplitis demolitor TaxID=69319 RepID=UPI0004CCC2A8|nr:cyclic AMP-responsive element-binding protein 1 isoform X2 [Microplitis demolitor]XP_057320719.1 cyclic AMP-responsive element-binding protein 1 isoform X2 [Microplitis mediator]
MESMVEENGSAVDPLSPDSHSGDSAPAIATSVQSLSRSQQQTHHLVASTSIVHLTLPTSGTTQVQSVIQPNHQSVIQSATNIQPVAISKGNVILVSKPNSVIQSAQGSLQTLQVVETASDDSFSDEESPKKRRDLLTRRASYRKILNDLSASEIAAGPLPPLESSLECDSNVDSDMSSHSLQYQTVIPAGTIQIATQGEGVPGLHTLTMSNATTAGGTIVQYAQGQDTQFFVPGHGVVVEDAARKREMRLQKNREAARECRRKKKEYIKCLENRVAVLENRNQTLIDELKTLKELYQHQQKAE